MLRNSFGGDAEIDLNSGVCSEVPHPQTASSTNRILIPLESSVEKHVHTLTHTHTSIWPASHTRGFCSTRLLSPSYHWQSQMFYLRQGSERRKGYGKNESRRELKSRLDILVPSLILYNLSTVIFTSTARSCWGHSLVPRQ